MAAITIIIIVIIIIIIDIMVAAVVVVTIISITTNGRKKIDGGNPIVFQRVAAITNFNSGTIENNRKCL